MDLYARGRIAELEAKVERLERLVAALARYARVVDPRSVPSEISELARTLMAEIEERRRIEQENPPPLILPEVTIGPTVWEHLDQEPVGVAGSHEEEAESK